MQGIQKIIWKDFWMCSKKSDIFYKNLKTPWAFSSSFLKIVGAKMAKIGQNGSSKKLKIMKISKIYIWGSQNAAEGPKIYLERLLKAQGVFKLL